MNQQWIRASEIGEYLYCQRAWWLRLQGTPSANVRELSRGSESHSSHGRRMRTAAWQRGVAFALMALALALLVFQIVIS